VKLPIWFGISTINLQYWSYRPTDNPNDWTLGPQQKFFRRILRYHHLWTLQAALDAGQITQEGAAA